MNSEHDQLPVALIVQLVEEKITKSVLLLPLKKLIIKLLQSCKTVAITWHVFLVACVGGVTLNGSSSGVVSSPNFPGNFPPSSRCTWTINVPSGRIKLTFHNFTLNPGENTDCSGGAQGVRVKITNVASDDEEKPFQLCGRTIPPPVYSFSTYMQIQLFSEIPVYSGFNASYETITDEMCK